MAQTESKMLPLKTKAPAFVLPNVISGKQNNIDELLGSKGTLIVFICNHCPYVFVFFVGVVVFCFVFVFVGIKTISISSNSIETHPQDGPEAMKKFAAEQSFHFPYLYDASQSVALDYDAACTPDFYLFDKNAELFYRGRFDASRPGNDLALTGEDLRAATTALLQNSEAPLKQYPSLGCNIKWHPEN
jgi:hypothetical protein